VLYGGYRDNWANFLTNSVSIFVTEPQLDYNTHIGYGKLKFMLGATWQQTEYAHSYISAYNFSNDALLTNIGAASGTENKSSGASTYKYQSVFLRANYDWKENGC
jgi:hypothetical protein